MAQDRKFSDTVIRHLTDIASGKCNISENDIVELHATEPDSAEILMGLSHLHEDLIYYQQEQKLALQREENKNKKLAEAIEQAKTASAVKSQFLANMSHEIRTPMNGIIGILSMLENSELDSSQQNLISIMRSSSDTLLLILNDILDFSRIESGAVELDLVDIDLGKCISECTSLYSYAAEAKNISLNQSISDKVPEFLRGDITRLKQIIGNLLSNATKFTSEGKIDLNVDASSIDDERVTLSIEAKDTGMGISVSEQQKLFESFTQAEQQPASAPSDQSLADSHPHDILVVEDNEINQVVVMANLERFGYACDVVSNGQEALDIVKKKHYSLILMDVQMPVMDGITATKAIIEKYKSKAPTIVALTANTFTDDRDNCIAAGMQDFIAKPINTDNIVRVLKKFSNSPS